jgi:hypothetical protein
LNAAPRYFAMWDEEISASRGDAARRLLFL